MSRFFLRHAGEEAAMWQWGNIFSKSGADGRARRQLSGMPSIISPAMRVTGDLSIEGELQFEGIIDGDI